MYLPPTERVAPACEEDQHGTWTEWARLQRQWSGPCARRDRDITTRGAYGHDVGQRSAPLTVAGLGAHLCEAANCREVAQ